MKQKILEKYSDEEEIEQARIVRKRRGQEIDCDVILNVTSAPPLVIVDAYNVIFKWPRLRKWMTKGMLSKARSLILHDLEELRMLKGWRIEVVFDGYGKPTVGPLGDGPGGIKMNEKISNVDQQETKKVTDHGVRIVFSGAGTSADGYIELRCYEAKEITGGRLTGSLIVVSDDAMIRNAAVNGGAYCMSADRMINELKAVKRSTMYRIEKAVAKANGHEIRPVQLQGKEMPNVFTEGSIVIEDKRGRQTKKARVAKYLTLDEMRNGTKNVPSWAIIPNETRKFN